MMKKKWLSLVIIGLLAVYFYPVNAYGQINHRVSINEITRIHILTIFPGLGPDNTKDISGSEDLEKIWYAFKDMRLIRLPIRNLSTGMSEEKLFKLTLLDRDNKMYDIGLDESLLRIDGKPYWILNRADLDEEVFIDKTSEGTYE